MSLHPIFAGVLATICPEPDRDEAGRDSMQDAQERRIEQRIKTMTAEELTEVIEDFVNADEKLAEQWRQHLRAWVAEDLETAGGAQR